MTELRPTLAAIAGTAALSMRTGLATGCENERDGRRAA